MVGKFKVILHVTPLWPKFANVIRVITNLKQQKIPKVHNTTQYSMLITYCLILLFLFQQTRNKPHNNWFCNIPDTYNKIIVYTLVKFVIYGTYLKLLNLLKGKQLKKENKMKVHNKNNKKWID